MAEHRTGIPSGRESVNSDGEHTGCAEGQPIRVRLAVVLAAHEIRQGGRAGLGAQVKERGCSLEGEGSR